MGDVEDDVDAEIAESGDVDVFNGEGRGVEGGGGAVERGGGGGDGERGEVEAVGNWRENEVGLGESSRVEGGGGGGGYMVVVVAVGDCRFESYAVHSD